MFSIPKQDTIPSSNSTLDTVPAEVYVYLFTFMNDESILSFLLASKTLSKLLVNASFWQTMMMPRLSSGHQVFIREMNCDYKYKDFFISRIGLNASIRWASSFQQSNIFWGKVFRIGDKIVDLCKVYQYIKQDKEIELLNEVSKISELLPDILSNNYKKLSRFYKMDFIGYLMPEIVNAKAEKCFELFIRTFISYSNYHKNNSRARFSELSNTIFGYKDPYFTFLFIKLTFEMCCSAQSSIRIVDLCIKHEVRQLLFKAIKNISDEILLRGIENISPQHAVVITVVYPLLKKMNYYDADLESIMDRFSQEEILRIDSSSQTVELFDAINSWSPSYPYGTCPSRPQGKYM